MSLESQIKDLRRQRDEELATLRYTVVRTKRDTMRAMNPDRQIRKHIGLAMGAAFLGAMLLAPAPKYTKPGMKKAKEPGWKKMLLHYFPQLKEVIPGLGEELRAEAPGTADMGPTQAQAEPAHVAPEEGYTEGFEEPAAAAYAEHHEAESHNGHRKQGKNYLKLLLAEIAANFASRVDWQQLIGQLTQQFMQKMQGRAGQTSQQPPSVAIADAGTASADERIGGRFDEQA